MDKKPFWITILFCANLCSASNAMPDGYILKADSFKHYVEKFNENDTEYFPPSIPNEQAWEFMKANIPLLECPDRDMEEI